MKEKFFPLRIALYVCVSLLVLTTICALDDAFHILDCITHTLSILFADICPNIQLMIPDNYSSFDILLSQISNTFIVLSLTAVLSTNVGYVYWIDIKDHKLVEPLFSCFIAIMTYLLTDLCFSVIVYLLNKPDSLFLSFLVSIILLIWLSYKMISVYFGRNRMKQKLLLTYLQDKWTVDLAVLCKNNSSSTEAYRDNLRRVYPTGEILQKFDRFCARWFKLPDAKKEKMAAQSKDRLLTYENAIYENTIRALSENNKQIIISSDRPPKEITPLEDRLRSRFECGLIADIQSPDFETRIAILRKKADSESISVPDDVMEYIANMITSNISMSELFCNLQCSIENSFSTFSKFVAHFISPFRRPVICSLLYS